MHKIVLRFAGRYIIYLYITLVFQLINEVAKNNFFCVEIVLNCSNHVRHVLIFEYNIGASINDDVDVQYLKTKIGRFISV